MRAIAYPVTDKDMELIKKCAADENGLILTKDHEDARDIMRKAHDNNYNVLAQSYKDFIANRKINNVNLYLLDIESILNVIFYTKDHSNTIKLLTMNIDNIKITNNGVVLSND
jgi:hypothetical protein